MEPQSSKMGIKSWALEDRPREKLMLKGIESLSDAELIAILIGSGNTEDTAVELAKKILASVQNNLHELGQQSVSDLVKFKGIGEAKAISIVSALELGRRRKVADIINKKRILSTADAGELFQALLGDCDHEEFWILLLNRGNFIIDKQRIGQGGTAGVIVDIRIILKSALEKLASAIILCHNHPSGNLEPSTQDINLTKRLKDAAKIMDIQLIDHFIVSNTKFYSFADHDLM